MKAIYKREVSSYFNSMIGWIFVAVLTVFIGIYFFAYNLFQGYPYFSMALKSSLFIFMVVIPILTMRSMAEDRRSKTDQLLLTSPVTIPQIVLGKYLAQLVIFAVPVLVACVMPLILTAFGTVSLISAYASLLAYFLLGAACIAVGTFISVLTENQIIAYLATFGLLLLSYLMNDIQTLFTTGNTLAFIVFCVILVVAAALVGLVCKSLTVGCGVFCAGAVLLIVLGLNIVFHSFSAYKKAEHNSEAKV